MMRFCACVLMATMAFSAAAIPAGVIAKLGDEHPTCAQVLGSVTSIADAIKILQKYDSPEELAIRVVMTQEGWLRPISFTDSVSVSRLATGAHESQVVTVYQVLGEPAALLEVLRTDSIAESVAGVLDLKAPNKRAKRVYPNLQADLKRFDGTPIELESTLGGQDSPVAVYSGTNYFWPRLTYMQRELGERMEIVNGKTLKAVLDRFKTGVMLAKVGDDIIVVSSYHFLRRLRGLQPATVKGAGYDKDSRPEGL